MLAYATDYTRTLEREMNYKYEPIKGYSVPVVRVSNDMGRVLFTLSFDIDGRMLGTPTGQVTKKQISDAWDAWVHK